MPSPVKFLRCSLANMIILIKFTEALRGNCSLDAAVTYTRDNVTYLFKGSKYVQWENGNFLGVVTGTSYFLNVFIFFLLFTYSVEVFVPILQWCINVWDLSVSLSVCVCFYLGMVVVTLV